MVSFKQFLLEGGNAVKGVTRIKKECVKPTVDFIYNQFLSKLGISKKDFALLGSAGKKETSGDLDIAIFYPPIVSKHKLEHLSDVYQFLLDKAKKIFPEVKFMKGIGLISVKCPIQCKEQENEFVQVDFMLTDDLNFTTWMYFGPAPTESKYKGLYRNILLFAIAKEVSYKIKKEKDNIPIEYERWILSLDKGLKKTTYSRQGRTKLLKTAKKISEEIITKNPDEIVKLLLGDDFKATDIMTFESLWKAIHSSKFKYKDKLNSIIKTFKEFCISDGFTLPEEVK